MPNYGDVSLNLSPAWSRDNLASGHEFMAAAVGHSNGVSDLHLKADPDKQHEFKWVAPQDVVVLNALRAKRYDYVKGSAAAESEWVKNPLLVWEWDGEGYCVYQGQRAMFRDAALYFAERVERERIEAARLAEQKRRRGDYLDRDDEYAARRLGAQGVVITDNDGRELRPMKRRA